MTWVHVINISRLYQITGQAENKGPEDVVQWVSGSVGQVPLSKHLSL